MHAEKLFFFNLKTKDTMVNLKRDHEASEGGMTDPGCNIMWVAT